jgi:hypothetical protein
LLAELVGDGAVDGEVGAGHHGDFLGHLPVDVGGLFKLNIRRIIILPLAFGEL